jgi:cytochrome c5
MDGFVVASLRWRFSGRLTPLREPYVYVADVSRYTRQSFLSVSINIWEGLKVADWLKVIGAFGVALALVVVAIPANGDISERIEPVGSVCVEGDECGVAGAASSGEAAADAGPRSGEQVYNESCNMCHGTGAAGAPKMGEATAWVDRIAQGNETLYMHAIKGLNGMPAMGLCMKCSEDEIKLAVDFMVESSQ